MSTHHIDHPTLGPVTVTERRGSAKLSARWKNCRLYVNLPAGVSRRQIEAALDRHRADFERIRPRPRYSPGTVIEILNDDGSTALEIAVETSASATKIDARISSSGPVSRIIITIPSETDFASPDIQARINTAVHTCGRHVAADVLLPQARRLAAKLGLRIDKWEITRGHNVLGTCYPRERRIRLSYINVFLSPELRDYIILHELAHITESGHTPAFHALLDRYCEGRETQLISLLHNYHWPIER